MNSDIVSLIIILICVMLSAYFSATETSFTSLNRIRMKNMAEKGDKRAELVLKLLENFDKLLSTILVGNNIVNIGLSSLATVLFIKLLGGDSGATVSTIVTTIVVLIFGEVSPKSIAKESPETIAKFSAPFLHILMIMLTPVTFLFSQWKKLLSRIFKSSENHGITDEELMTIVEEATQEGDIDDQEGDLIQNAIGFMERPQRFLLRVSTSSAFHSMRRNPRSLRLSPTPDFPGCRYMMMISTTLWELCIRRISTTTFTTPTNR